MKIKKLFLITSLLLLLQTFLPFPVFAQDDSISITSDVSYSYGDSMVFNARVSTDKELVRAVVYLRSGADGLTDVIHASISSTGNLTLTATQDLSVSSPSPFSRLTYWWHLDFIDGSTYDSPVEPFQYFDNRYVWNFSSGKIENSNIQVFWKSASIEFGQMVIDLTTKQLPDLTNLLGVQPPSEISFFIYQSPEEMLPDQLHSGDTFIGGKTLPLQNTILLVVTDDDQASITLERLLPHELSHLMLYQRMGDSYDNLPDWLAEGFSVLQEETPDPLLRISLEEAAENNELLSIQSLCGTFPVDGNESVLSYAQSASFLQYILDIYGVGGLSALLDAYKEGTTCEGGISRVFQRDLSDLDQEWRASIGVSKPSSFSSFMPWLLLSIPLFLLLVYTLFLRRRPS